MGKNKTNQVDRKKGITMLLIFSAILFSFIFLLFIILWIRSSGKPEPFYDSSGRILKGSLSEKTFVTIGGVKQGMFIRSENLNNPVLLYIHGGPAFPNYFLIEKYKPGLEKYFTVCYWEQRGGGLSYTPEVSSESMNYNQLTSDAIEVTKYLQKRFNQPKIYMLAHSGGTPVALKAARRAPELYYAYIGMAQITQQKESEKIAYHFMLGEYETAGNKKAVKELKKYFILDSDSNLLLYYKSGIRDKFMHELGIGTMHKMNSIIIDIFVPVWTCKAYTLQEKYKIWKSKFTFLPRTQLASEVLSLDEALEIQKVDIPVYFISGKYDLTVNIDLSRSYLEKLQAPQKAFYTFQHSAHSPLFEEPEKFMEIVEKDVLNGTIELADK